MTNKSGQLGFEYINNETGSQTLILVGSLEVDGVSEIWSDIVRQLRKSPPDSLTVDLDAITNVDGAGIGLLVEIDQIVRGQEGKVRFENLADEQRKILELALLRKPGSQSRVYTINESFLTQLGRSAMVVVCDMKAIVEFSGELFMVLIWAMGNPHRVRWRDAFVAMEKVGANAVPVVCLLGFLVGLIIAFQCAGPMREFGAESFVATVVGISIVSELGPLMAAIILSGRSGSAFAAEIGTMKVTEEINALQTFGLNPTRFLVVPRMIATMTMTPLLGVFSTLMGLIGGYVVMAALGYSLHFYVDQIRHAVDYIDFLQGVFKSLVFAFLVAAIGCLRGLRTQSGPGGVGDSTTKAVVAGIVLIIIADAVLGTMFYYLGI